MRMTSRAIWIIIALIVVVLMLPLPIAERYTSPTQDGQYITNPARAYRFVVAAILVSPASELNTSGEALQAAKERFGADLRVNKVELLYFPDDRPYSYFTATGQTLTLEQPESFVWEVWGTVAGEPSSRSEVVGFLSYETGELLGSLER
jgi:hypothetical protein